MRHRVLCCARLAATTLALIACPSSDAVGQSRRLLDLLDQFERYFQLVERYRQGAHEGAIRELSEYNEQTIVTSVEAWRLLLSESVFADQRRPHLARARQTETLEAAALLHTATGMVAHDRGTAPGIEFHLGIAREFVRIRDLRRLSAAYSRQGPREAKEEATARQRFEADRHWALAVFFHGRWALEDAKRYMETAMALAPGETDRLFDAGRLFEASHAAQIVRLGQRYDVGRQNPNDVKRRMIDLAGANADLRRAETLFRNVLASGGAEVGDARLRLGRVLQVAEQTREATEELQRAIDLARDSSTAYLGELFLGRLAEQQGQVNSAISRYEAASTLRPRNQSAGIALARLLAEAGRVEQAGTLVTKILTTSRDRGDEPWWLYHYPDEDTLSRIVGAMQERLR